MTTYEIVSIVLAALVIMVAVADIIISLLIELIKSK